MLLTRPEQASEGILFSAICAALRFYTAKTHLGHRRVAPERQRDAARVLPERPSRYCGSGLATGKDIFLDDRVNAPISINHLGDAEVDADRN